MQLQQLATHLPDAIGKVLGPLVAVAVHQNVDGSLQSHPGILQALSKALHQTKHFNITLREQISNALTMLLCILHYVQDCVIRTQN